jgi:uncharacterized protein (DUF2336 family)
MAHVSEFQGLIADLETAIQDGQQDKRVAILRQVTDLFIGGARGFNDEHIELFGDVLTHLVNRVESKALAEVSAKLAPVTNAPDAIIQRLARHDEIAVAGPVLTQSERLSESDLVEIAKSKGQQHLGAISERARLAAAVTDVLVERGDTTVVRKLSLNRGAEFSSTGFDTLTNRAEHDEQLAENLGGRIDLPPDVLQNLMARATEQVRGRLLAGASTERKAEIQKAIDAASAQVAREAAVRHNFERAEKLVEGMKYRGQLNEDAIVNFAYAGKYEEMVMAIAKLCLAPIEMIDPLVRSPVYDGLLTACKACDFSTKTFCAILSNRFPDRSMSEDDLNKACADYHKMSSATAKRIYRFWLVRGVAQKQ